MLAQLDAFPRAKNKFTEAITGAERYLIITHVKKESKKQLSLIWLLVIICLSWWKNINKKRNLFEPSLQYCQFGQDGCNNGQKVGDKFKKLSKIGFTMECFSGDFFPANISCFPRRFEDVLKTSSAWHFSSSKTSSGRLQDVFAIRLPKTSWKRLQDDFKTSFKTSSRHLQDVFATRLPVMSSRREDVLEDKKMLH